MKKYLSRLSLILLCLVAMGGGLYWIYRTQSPGIYQYDSAKDKAFITNIFDKDWYWLISDHSPDYAVEYMLDYRASSQYPSGKGKLTIKAFRVKGKPVGFSAYFMEEFYRGRILFVSVDKEYRSKGYAKKLMLGAIEDLKKRGARLIYLITRTDNKVAQKLYAGLGFKETWTDVAYVKFELPIS